MTEPSKQPEPVVGSTAWLDALRASAKEYREELKRIKEGQRSIEDRHAMEVRIGGVFDLMEILDAAARKSASNAKLTDAGTKTL